MLPYDILVIGGGSAGYNAATVAAALGQRVAVVDGARRLGGLCILKGCMPSKTLLLLGGGAPPRETRRPLRTQDPVGPRRHAWPLHSRKLKKIIDEFADYRTHQPSRPETLSSFAAGRGSSIRIRSNSPMGSACAGGISSSRPAPRSAYRRFRDCVNPAAGRATTCSTSTSCRAASSFWAAAWWRVTLAQFLRRVGTQVTVLQRSPHLLRSHSPEAADVVKTAFVDEGIEVLTGTPVQSVSHGRRGFTVKALHRGRLVVRRADHCSERARTRGLHGGIGPGRGRSEDGSEGTNRDQSLATGPRPLISTPPGDCSGPRWKLSTSRFSKASWRRGTRLGVKRLKPVNFHLLRSASFSPTPAWPASAGARANWSRKRSRI